MNTISNVKFNQGIYLFPLDWMIDNETFRETVYAELEAHPNIKGMKLRVYPNRLEPEEGVYDFSLIDSVLTRLTAMGKQLFLIYMYKSWGSEYPLPAYLNTPLNENGAYQFSQNGGTNPVGYHSKLWVPEVVAGINKQVNEIGRIYNKHPNFEGIVFPETAANPPISGFTMTEELWTGYYNGVLSVAQNAMVALPNCSNIQFVNYPKDVLTWLVPALVEAGMGVGGPDTFRDEIGLIANPVDNPFTLPGAYYYYPPLKNVVPLGPSIQKKNFISTTNDGTGPKPTVEEIYSFARDNLKGDYVFITRQPEYVQDIYPFVDSIQADNGGLLGSNPSSFILR